MQAASVIARFIIAFCQEHGDPISNLRLQKLLYYAQAWHLALHDRALFREPIEAWVHGPVVPSVYVEYKHCSWQPILEAVVEPPLPKDTTDHLREVMDVYGGLTALRLEQLTHDEAPWRNARKGLPSDAASHNEISHEDMKRFYRAMLPKNGHTGFTPE